MRSASVIGHGFVIAFLLTVVQVGGAEPQTTVLRTMAPLETGVEGLETQFVPVIIDGSRALGPMPPMQGDLSQGAETGDPLYFEEMEGYLAELNPRLIRVSPFSNIGQAVSLDENGALEINFAGGDRIIQNLRRTGARICWNCASWPKDWSEGHANYPKDPAVWQSFIRQVVERYNTGGERGIDYIEFWNEPPSFNTKLYEILARTATEIDPGVKVGAPAVMDLKLSAIEKAVRHCHETDTPLHFISFHLYYKPPWEWPEIIARAQAVLDKYPGMEDLEMLVTEWGIDAGESGSCDTRFNAAYYSSVLERMIPHWPQVRPMHFELRDGWDWKGPSRDLFGRWGMLTYSNLLPKPVFQAARMWAQMEGERVECRSTDERIRAVASVAPEKMTILLWSYPPQYQRMQANDPEHGPSVLDIPVRLLVDNLPIRSPGLSYERYALDWLHSNITTDYGRSSLEKVQEVVLARHSDKDAFRVETVMPLHGVSLIVIRPAERAPADVEAAADRYQIWAGQSAEITIKPKFDENFPLESIPARGGPDAWRTEVIANDPLTLRVTPELPAVRAQQFYTAWVKRTDWRAIGRALVEFRTDVPIESNRESWRVDLAWPSKSGEVRIPLRNRAPARIGVDVQWAADTPLRVERADRNVRLAPGGDDVLTASIATEGNALPARYLLHTTLNTGVEIETLETEVFLPMISAYTEAPPTLDGRLDEWGRQIPLVIDGGEHWGGHHASRWDGLNDLSGKLWSRWDDRALYFAVEVTDDHHDAPIVGPDMQKFDCVHLGFDLRRDALDKREFFVEDDCHYGIALLDRGVAYRFWGAKRREEVAKPVRVAAVREGNITTYEIAMPFEEEFEPYATAKAGHVMGFSVYLRDRDPDEEPGHLRWGQGLDWHEIRPAKFYSLQLVRP